MPARVHIAVVDRDGDLLGVFRMDDGPNFGYDVAIQKARTAAFFSDDNHAITTRALGFMSQKFFPIGINENSPVGGPFFEVQDRLFLTGIATNPTVLAMPYIQMMPVFARDVLDVGASGLGLLMAASGAGVAEGGRTGLTAVVVGTSGGIVLAQFIGFLFIGVLLFAFYHPFTDPGYATASSAAFPFTGGDRVFPDFITRHLPTGLSGLVVDRYRDVIAVQLGPGKYFGEIEFFHGRKSRASIRARSLGWFSFTRIT